MSKLVGSKAVAMARGFPLERELGRQKSEQKRQSTKQMTVAEVFPFSHPAATVAIQSSSKLCAIHSSGHSLSAVLFGPFRGSNGGCGG